MHLKPENKSFGNAILDTCYGSYFHTIHLTGFASCGIDLRRKFFRIIAILIGITGVWFCSFNACHLEAKGASYVWMNTFVASLEVIVGADRGIPVISHLRIDITLRGYDHIGYTVVAFYIVFLGSQADVHAKLEIDVPVVRQKILAFDSSYIDQTIIIQTTDIQIAVQVTGVIRSSIGKSDDSFGVGELGKQIRGVLIEELSATK